MSWEYRNVRHRPYLARNRFMFSVSIHDDYPRKNNRSPKVFQSRETMPLFVGVSASFSHDYSMSLSNNHPPTSSTPSIWNNDGPLNGWGVFPEL
jgi:hypothetical protein